MPAGIEHLTLLKEIMAEVECIDVPQSEREEAESAFRSAVSLFPTSPDVHIRWDDYDYQYWGRDHDLGRWNC